MLSRPVVILVAVGAHEAAGLRVLMAITAVPIKLITGSSEPARTVAGAGDSRPAWLRVSC